MACFYAARELLRNNKNAVSTTYNTIENQISMQFVRALLADSFFGNDNAYHLHIFYNMTCVLQAYTCVLQYESSIIVHTYLPGSGVSRQYVFVIS